MGLDVYLYRYETFDDTIALQERVESEAEAIDNEYPKYDEMTQAQKDEARARTVALYEENGLGKWGEAIAPEVVEVNLPSVTNPDHMFRIGYWRSSYNAGGINSFLNRQIGTDLYGICGRGADDSYYFQPDWKATAERCSDALRELEAQEAYDVITILNFRGSEVNPARALEVFLQEKDAKAGHPFSNYSCLAGDFFFGDPITVHAVIPGERGDTHLIVSRGEENNRFYLEALRIVIETCEYVLSQPDPEKYYLHWSA